MDGEIRCVYDRKEKKYVLPTHNWLKPYREHITEDLNEDGLLMVSGLMNREKILVKITDGNNRNIITFNNMLNGKPNFIETYYNFSCLENKENVENKYENEKGYCNPNVNTSNKNERITLELMKRYNDGSLNKRIGKIIISIYINIVRQLIISQIYAFEKYGFIHTDLHLGNILLKTHTNNRELKYIIKNNPYKEGLTEIKINTKIIIILTDFTYCISYNPEIYNRYNRDFLDKTTFDKNNTLLNRIIISLLESTKLLDEKNEIIMYNKIKNYINMNDNYKRNLNFSIKALNNYYMKYIDYERFVTIQCTLAIQQLDELFKIMTDNNEILSDEFILRIIK